MQEIHDVSIKSEGVRTFVNVDGKPVHGVQGINCRVKVGEAPTVELDVLRNTEFSGKAIVIRHEQDVLCLANTGTRLKRDGKTYEVVCADARTFVLGEADGGHVSYNHLEAYSNDPSINTLENLNFERV